jgi:hypothetical protein
MTLKAYQQGQSDATEFKERGLEAAFSINARIFKSKFGDRFTYWHFDLNCGSGVNEKIGCIGSPVAFVRAAESVGCSRYFAGFCDINAGALKSLSEIYGIKENSQCFLFHGENASLVEAIPDLIGSREKANRAVGMVLSDPNGFEVPLNELATLAVKCPGIDIAIHWNSRIRRLYRGQGWAFVDIDEAIAMLGKRHWLIRKPQGAHQWTVLIGRNVRVGEHKTLGFYHLDSEMGQDIMARCKARLQQDDTQMELAI